MKRSRGEMDTSDATADVATANDSSTIRQRKSALAGRIVTVRGVGGSIWVDPSDCTTVTSAFRKETPFRVEAVDRGRFGREEHQESLVAFRVIGMFPPRYLTVSMYGDEPRNAVADGLSRFSPLSPPVISDIVDYAIGRSTDASNFEGQGFNYSPIRAEEGPPGEHQVFNLSERYYGRYGIKTAFDTYLRAQHWEKRVGQSAHCLADERWVLTLFD